MNKIEVWKDVVGYEGKYEISNFGRVKSVERIVQHPRCGDLRVKEKIMKNHKYRDMNYLYACLSTNGKSKQVRIHRMVAMAFIENPANKPFVNHLDGDGMNNKVDNLEWCTASENTIHAYENNLMKGIRKVRQKVEQQDLNGNPIRSYYSVKDASEDNDITYSNIRAVAKGKRKTAGGYKWKYIV